MTSTDTDMIPPDPTATKRLPVATSIYPPSLKRHDKTGECISLKYFNACKTSWKDAGFDWLSVNRQAELELIDSFSKEVPRFSFEETDAIAPGKYGPTIGALYQATAPNAIAGICNADTFVMRGSDTSGTILSAAKGSFIIARRTEVDGWEGPLHSVNVTGIDAIFFDREAFRPVFTHRMISRFQMGMPWWDIVLPVAASFHAPLRQIREPWLMHLRHAQAWNRDQYRSFGKLARDCIINYAGEISSQSERAREFLARYHAAVPYPENLELRKQLSLFSDVCRAWLWNDHHPEIIEMPIDAHDTLFRKSLDATLFKRMPFDSQLIQLDNTAGLGTIFARFFQDVKHLFRLFGRHFERWVRGRLRATI